MNTNNKPVPPDQRGREGGKDLLRSFEVTLYQSQWDELIKLIDHEVTKRQGIIKRTVTFSSITCSSDLTREKHRDHIEFLKGIAEKITEAYL